MKHNSYALQELSTYFRSDLFLKSNYQALQIKLAHGSAETPPLDYHPDDRKLKQIHQHRFVRSILSELPPISNKIFAEYYHSPRLYPLQVKSAFFQEHTYGDITPVIQFSASFQRFKGAETTVHALQNLLIQKNRVIRETVINETKALLQFHHQLFEAMYKEHARKAKGDH